jgi:ribonucleoside-diphosphate reductase alpha chain
VKTTRKRDGVTLQAFDTAKLRKAISLAWADSLGEVDEKAVSAVIKTVLNSLSHEIVDVEVVQDAVETALMRHGQFAVAKAYILYRHQRQEARQLRAKAVDPKGLSDYIHAGKYARYLPELKRREVYEETVARVEGMHIQQFPQMETEIREAFDLVRAKRLLPSMRSMQFAGAAILANHNRIYNCSFSLVDRFEAFSEALFLLLSGCGVGYSVQFDHVENLPSIPYIDTKNVVHHVVEDNIEGWADALKALLQSYQDRTNLEFSFYKIRPAGTPLKTSGGRAPGHLKLKESLERIRVVLSAAQGRKLRPI